MYNIKWAPDRSINPGFQFLEGLYFTAKGRKIQFLNQYTDLSLEINHVDSHISKQNQIVRINSFWIWTLHTL